MSKANRNKMPEDRRQYARSEETRARILSAALEETIRVGFHKVSMANIAAKADVAVGILNYHFGSRQKMLHELMSIETQKFWSHMFVPRADRGFFEYEAAIVRVYLEFLHANPSHLQLAEEIRRHEPELYRQGAGEQLEGIVERIEAAIRRGELASMNMAEIRTRAYLIYGSYTFLDRLIEDNEYPGDEFVISIVINMFKSGFAPI